MIESRNFCLTITVGAGLTNHLLHYVDALEVNAFIIRPKRRYPVHLDRFLGRKLRDLTSLGLRERQGLSRACY